MFRTRSLGLILPIPLLLAAQTAAFDARVERRNAAHEVAIVRHERTIHRRRRAPTTPTTPTTPAPPSTPRKTVTPTSPVAVPTRTPTRTAAPGPAPSPTAPISPQPDGAPGVWTLEFDDEFNGTSLDTTKWTALGPAYNNNNIHPNPADVSVSGGDLILTLSAAGSGSTLGSGGMISSSPQDGASAGFDLPVGGFMQASIDFPGPGTTAGTAVDNWPTWWASSEGNTWPVNGEEDVFEGLGTATSNYHYGSSTDAQSSPINSGPLAGDWSNSFHTYGLYRGPASCTVYYDGKIVTTYATHDGGGTQQLVLTAGSSTGPDATISSPSVTGSASAIKVDYVRAWIPAS